MLFPWCKCKLICKQFLGLISTKPSTVNNKRRSTILYNIMKIKKPARVFYKIYRDFLIKLFDETGPFVTYVSHQEIFKIRKALQVVPKIEKPNVKRNRRELRLWAGTYSITFIFWKVACFGFQHFQRLLFIEGLL